MWMNRNARIRRCARFCSMFRTNFPAQEVRRAPEIAWDTYQSVAFSQVRPSYYIFDRILGQRQLDCPFSRHTLAHPAGLRTALRAAAIGILLTCPDVGPPVMLVRKARGPPVRRVRNRESQIRVRPDRALSFLLGKRGRIWEQMTRKLWKT